MTLEAQQSLLEEDLLKAPKQFQLKKEVGYQVHHQPLSDQQQLPYYVFCFYQLLEFHQESESLHLF